MDTIKKTENLLYSFRDRIPNNGVDLGLYNIYNKESKNLKVRQSSIYYYYSILLVFFLSIISVMSFVLLLMLDKISIGIHPTNIFYFVSLVSVFIALLFFLCYVSFVFSAKIQAKKRLNNKRIDIITKFINLYTDSNLEYLWYIKPSRKRIIHSISIDKDNSIFFSCKNKIFSFELKTNRNIVNLKNKDIISSLKNITENEFKLYKNENNNYNYSIKLKKISSKKTEVISWMQETYLIIFAYSLILNSTN